MSTIKLESTTFGNPGSAAVKFKFDRNKLPEEVKSYKDFLQYFGHEVGDVIVYVAVPKFSSTQYYLLESDLSHSHARMKVSEWNQWYQENKADIISGKSIILKYLVNIPACSSLHRKLQQQFPETIGKWSDIGPTSLNQFIREYDEDIPIPPMQAKLYLSPPVPGGILTPPHLDGYGTQASVHAVLFGQGCHNIVQFWDRQNHLTSSSVEEKFREIVKLAPIPTEYKDFHLPHDQHYMYASDPLNNTLWNTRHSKLLTESNICAGETILVEPGEVIFLPANTYHAFLKHHSNLDQPADYYEPMLGYAGDTTYIGETGEQTKLHLNHLQLTMSKLANFRIEPYVYWELAILCLFLRNTKLSSENKKYARALSEILTDVIIPQANKIILLHKLDETKLEVDSIDDSKYQEYNCCHCKRGIFMLYGHLNSVTKNDLVVVKRKHAPVNHGSSVSKKQKRDLLTHFNNTIENKTDETNIDFSALVCSYCLESPQYINSPIPIRCRFLRPSEFAPLFTKLSNDL